VNPEYIAPDAGYQVIPAADFTAVIAGYRFRIPVVRPTENIPEGAQYWRHDPSVPAVVTFYREVDGELEHYRTARDAWVACRRPPLFVHTL